MLEPLKHLVVVTFNSAISISWNEVSSSSYTFFCIPGMSWKISFMFWQIFMSYDLFHFHYSLSAQNDICQQNLQSTFKLTATAEIRIVRTLPLSCSFALILALSSKAASWSTVFCSLHIAAFYRLTYPSTPCSLPTVCFVAALHYIASCSTYPSWLYLLLHFLQVFLELSFAYFSRFVLEIGR